MAILEVEDSQTGKIVKFDWQEDREPTQSDLLAVFAENNRTTQTKPEMSAMQKAGLGILHGGEQAALGVAQAVYGGGDKIREILGMERPNTQRIADIQSSVQNSRDSVADLTAESNAAPWYQPTAFGAGNAAGQTAATMAIPGGVVGGGLRRAGTSALAGGAVGALQPTIGNESVGRNAALGAVAGAGGSGMLSGAGKVGNALMDRLPPNFKEALSRKFGIRTTLGEVTGNATTQTAETWLEKVPLLGLRGFREKQQKESDVAANTLLSHYMINPTAVDPMKANRAYENSLYETMKREVVGIEDQAIPPSQTRQAAIDVLDRYPDLFKKFQDKKREDLLKNITSDTADPTQTIKTRDGNYLSPDEWTTASTPASMTFKDAWMLRDSLGEMIGQAKKKLASGDVDKTQFSEISKLYSAVNNDIDSWAGNVGRPDVRTMINEANDAYKKYVVKYDIIQRAYDKATSLTGDSEKFSPQKFSTALYKTIDGDKAYGRFSPTEVEEMAGLANLMSIVKRSGQFKENPPTGNRYGLPVTAAAGGIMGTMKAIPIVSMSRFLVGTEPGKRIALAASKMDSDNPNMKVLLKMIYNQLPKYMATEATDK